MFPEDQTVYSGILKVNLERDAAEREKLRRENSEIGHQWSLRFLSQWAVLSGGTLILLVTFAQAHHSTYYSLFRASSALLLVSLITSALQIFLGGQALHHAARFLSGDANRTNYWSMVYPRFVYVPIISYVVAVVCSWFFVDANTRF